MMNVRWSRYLGRGGMPSLRLGHSLLDVMCALSVFCFGWEGGGGVDIVFCSTGESTRGAIELLI